MYRYAVSQRPAPQGANSPRDHLSNGLAALAGLALLACSSSDGARGTPAAATGGLTDDNCASITRGAQTSQGRRADTDDATVCEYGIDFVDFDNPINASITLSGEVSRHVFFGSLVLGHNAGSNAGLAALGISQGGDGPALTIEAGVTVAFRTVRDFMVVNRGAQLLVNGTAEAPVTMTSTADPSIGGTAPADRTRLWGGLVINGFGVVNSCSYSGTRGQSDFAPAASGCHVQSEGFTGGQATHYGGANDADSSGSLSYLIVKHAGAAIDLGNELNGITFNGVGSGTVVSNLQVYRSYDDGIELFGGAVDISNYVALYVADDSIDIDSGYSGEIRGALVIQDSADGNRCIEADGIASYDSVVEAGKVADLVARGLASAPTLRNITCIISANEESDAGESVPDAVKGTHGDAGEGLRLREGLRGTLEGLIVTNAYSLLSAPLKQFNDNLPEGERGWADNWCLDIEDADTTAAAASGDLVIRRSVFACSEAADADSDRISVGGAEMTEREWLDSHPGVIVADLDPLLNPGAGIDAGLVLFEAGSYNTVPVARWAFPGDAAIYLTTSVPGHAGGGADWAASWAFGLEDLWFKTEQ